MAEKRLEKNIDQIVRTLREDVMSVSLYLSQESCNINHQINTNDFQSHDNKCTLDISHP